MRDTYAIIPARGGSTRVPGKNLAPFAGKPLLAWTIRQAKGAKSVSGIYVSTDYDDIAAVAKREGAKVIKRPPELSHEHANVVDALKHAVADITAEIGRMPELVIFLNATKPLRVTKDIYADVDALYQQCVDSLFSGHDIDDFYILCHISLY